MMKDATQLAPFLLGLALIPAPALAEEPPPKTPKPAAESASAKVLEISATSTPWFFRGKPGWYAPHSALMVGVKEGAWITGAGLELAYLTMPDAGGNGIRIRRLFLTMQLSGTFQWTFGQSFSGNVDFFLAGRPSLGIGLQNDIATSRAAATTDPSIQRTFTSMLVGLRAGLGMRAWAHPNFGFGMQTGVEVEGKVGSSSSAGSPSGLGMDIGIYLSAGFMGAL